MARRSTRDRQPAADAARELKVELGMHDKLALRKELWTELSHRDKVTVRPAWVEFELGWKKSLPARGQVTMKMAFF